MSLQRRLIVSGSSLVAAALVGCSTPPPPPRVPVPQSPNSGSVKTYEPLRTLRDQTSNELIPPPAFDDVALVTQAPPEQPIFLDAYAKVGKPRVAVFVNRTIEGQIIPVNDRTLLSGEERRIETRGNVDIESRTTTDVYGRGRDRSTDTSGSIKSNGPSTVTDTFEKYLAAGEYDEVQAKSIDYQAIELALADTLSANGKVTLVSPMMARQRLSDQEVKELQEGRPQMLREIAEKLDADVLIQVQARATKQTSNGLGIRVLVEAINTKGGESVARSYVDIDPPLDKPTINKYTRFLARKVMYGLAGSWNAMSVEPVRTAEPARSSPTPLPPLDPMAPTAPTTPPQ